MDEELKSYLGALEERISGKVQTALNAAVDLNAAVEGMRGELDGVEARLTEKMRDMQTELLRGFEAFSNGQTIRLRKVEADQSNLDVSLRGRVEVVENRLAQIEQRLGKQ